MDASIHPLHRISALVSLPAYVQSVQCLLVVWEANGATALFLCLILSSSKKLPF